jgi:ParB family chromosome partitioning protein
LTVARKTGLGKGLDALLPGNNRADREAAPDGNLTLPLTDPLPAGKIAAPSAGGVTMLSPDKLIPNPDQPRKNFDEAELRELADSISEHGVIQPIIVAPAENAAADGAVADSDGANSDGAVADGAAGESMYIIIAGERRTRAARLAGLAEVPVIIRSYTDQKRMEISLIENIQRADLNPIEEATAYKNLMDFSRLSQDEVAARVGKNRSTVANALRLLKLPADIQKSIEEGAVSAGHARALLSVIDKKSREKLYREITAGGLSVREAEKRAAAFNSAGGGAAAETEKARPKRPPEIKAMEEKFIGRLGTKVLIDGDLNRGRISIDYYSMEDLDRLYEILGG